MRERLDRWQDAIDLRDEAGMSVRVSLHRFRHTLGTRLINAGVPQHVVQRMLGHASPQMTARYAILHDTTVRAASTITNASGSTSPVVTSGSTQRLRRPRPSGSSTTSPGIQASLPNGYCGRPPQQDCPHPNACLTCPDFQTTPEFLTIHRRHRDETAALAAAAEANGNLRVAGNHRQVQVNLERIIEALETMDESATR